jgi:hypothetical protein
MEIEAPARFVETVVTWLDGQGRDAMGTRGDR